MCIISWNGLVSAVGWLLYMDNDVFNKYPVVNGDWVLHKNRDDVGIKELWGTSLGSNMMAYCLDVGGVSNEVKSEVIKFDKVYEYYVRRVYRGSDFIVYSGIVSNGINGSSGRRDVIFRGYNVDPWGREFPYFIDNVDSNYYKSLDGSSGVKIRYGYWVFYRDRIITGTSGTFKLYYLLDNVAPLMVLTTTSIEGVTIACLDMVEGV